MPAIREKMTTLMRVGLGYIKVGQQATTLSGGEAQRVKLSKELARRSTGRTLYILDEPTTGLHFEDTRKLLEVLHELVEQGNTVVVIEHNLDVIKTADHIIDIGPEGGDGGGMIVATGTPEEIAGCRRATPATTCGRCSRRGGWRRSRSRSGRRIEGWQVEAGRRRPSAVPPIGGGSGGVGDMRRASLRDARLATETGAFRCCPVRRTAAIAATSEWPNRSGAGKMTAKASRMRADTGPPSQPLQGVGSRRAVARIG